MTTKQSRARFGAAIVVAFVCGLLFASGFDLTRFGWAQAKVPAAKTSPAEVKSLAETQDAFEAIADRVTPAVVSIQVQRTARNRPVSVSAVGSARRRALRPASRASKTSSVSSTIRALINRRKRAAPGSSSRRTATS
jgi:S1-C subfamily serine protease